MITFSYPRNSGLVKHLKPINVIHQDTGKKLYDILLDTEKELHEIQNAFADNNRQIDIPQKMRNRRKLLQANRGQL